MLHLVEPAQHYFSPGFLMNTLAELSSQLMRAETNSQETVSYRVPVTQYTLLSPASLRHLHHHSLASWAGGKGDTGYVDIGSRLKDFGLSGLCAVSRN